MQKVLVTRRIYNKFVCNEMQEDFALRFTAKRARKWSSAWIANTALGTVSFLVLEALGGAITLNYGVTNALWAILAVACVVFISGLPISYYAAKYGVDVDLLSRGAGFGYIGSTVVSLIYASFTFIFFALEAAIMSMALQLLLGIPLVVGYIISTVVVIPLVMHGISRIGKFQLWTQPLWLLMQLVPLFYVFSHPDSRVDEWLSFAGVDGVDGNSFDLLMFGAASAVLLSVVAQIGEQVDFLRFLPPPEKTTKLKWWSAVILGGPGWMFVGAAKLVLGSFLAYLAVKHGVAVAVADDPAHMYQVVFSYVTDNPRVSVLLAAIFVIVSQLKINVANAYAGSLAWSNFFSRLTHSHPGRVVWMFFNVTIALLLMELGVYQAIESMLQVYSVLVLAWIGTLVADLIINKPLGLSPKHIEFKRSQLYDINPVGLGSMLIASTIGFMAHMDFFGEICKALASYMAFALPFITAPAIAYWTKGRFYLVRAAQPIDQPESTCSICEMEFEHEDMAWCPAYAGPICSLCCSLDVRCGDKCRPKATIGAQFKRWLSPYLNPAWMTHLSSSLGQFMLVMITISTIMAVILTLAYAQLPYEADYVSDPVFWGFVKAFFLLLILIGVVSWLFVLARSSGLVAMKEVQSHARLLTEEVEAHQETHKALQHAKELAETANQAKSRYLAGISHELRTPLNILLGYAQLLCNDDELTQQKRDYAHILKRSGEHLSDLLEGLLEISKIEAGRLELARDEFNVRALLTQLVDMFQLQAQRKGINFTAEISDRLPAYVAADKKRLRQILINLLNNAIKFTSKGSVTLSVSFRSDVARFSVSDTGIGIGKQDVERIFKPFERGEASSAKGIRGTGLGLTISNSLAELMGGEIRCDTQLGQGSTFTLSLMLAEVQQPESSAEIHHAKVLGYQGGPFKIMVVDDEPAQREMLHHMLTPLGFNIHQAADASDCISQTQSSAFDLYLLDIQMPGMSGWQLAEQLRAASVTAPIVMFSANTLEMEQKSIVAQLHDDYITKPVALETLLETLEKHLKLSWDFADDEATELITRGDQIPTADVLLQLKSWAEIGYMSAFSQKFHELEQDNRICGQFIERLGTDLKQCNFVNITHYLDTLIHEPSSNK
ncbi:response regulator [Neiella marina]|uniref:histidine kinase n=2 Tax=Neiella holothuriorum TaxID=2870530 RepID=A0ABS7EE83_9GAMM|nr:response regulator [Neiella holothuriorum]